MADSYVGIAKELTLQIVGEKNLLEYGPTAQDWNPEKTGTKIGQLYAAILKEVVKAGQLTTE